MHSASRQKEWFERFLAGAAPVVCVEPDGRIHRDTTATRLLLPGSFNPLHEGHRDLAVIAARRIGWPLAFELCVTNADKPPLTEAEVQRRLAQFAGLAPLWLTRAATFAEKGRLFPGTVFVIGADTAARVIQPRFYGDSETVMRSALAELRRLGCRFLVAGRLDAAGVFVEGNQLDLPVAFRDLFEVLPASQFRRDISSTRLRDQAGEP